MGGVGGSVYVMSACGVYIVCFVFVCSVYVSSQVVLMHSVLGPWIGKLLHLD